MMEGVTLQCPSYLLDNSRKCWHTGKEEEGSYHGSSCGNGCKGKKKVWGLAKCWGKRHSLAELFKKKGDRGKNSFELDMES